MHLWLYTFRFFFVLVSLSGVIVVGVSSRRTKIEIDRTHNGFDGVTLVSLNTKVQKLKLRKTEIVGIACSAWMSGVGFQVLSSDCGLDARD